MCRPVGISHRGKIVSANEQACALGARVGASERADVFAIAKLKAAGGTIVTTSADDEALRCHRQAAERFATHLEDRIGDIIEFIAGPVPGTWLVNPHQNVARAEDDAARGLIGIVTEAVRYASRVTGIDATVQLIERDGVESLRPHLRTEVTVMRLHCQRPLSPCKAGCRCSRGDGNQSRPAALPCGAFVFFAQLLASATFMLGSQPREHDGTVVTAPSLGGTVDAIVKDQLRRG